MSRGERRSEIAEKASLKRRYDLGGSGRLPWYGGTTGVSDGIAVVAFGGDEESRYGEGAAKTAVCSTRSRLELRQRAET